MTLSLLGVVAAAALNQAVPAELEPSAEAAEYATELRALGEGPLSAVTPPRARALRCTILPTDGDPVTARLVSSRERGILSSRRLERLGEAPRGTIRDSVISTLDAALLRNLESHVDRERLAALSSNEAGIGERPGARWILELVEDGRHHAVVRWSPRADARVRGTERLVEACTALFTAAGLPLPR